MLSKKGKKNILKRSLFAATAVLAIGATTVGAQSNDYWTMFFGETASIVGNNTPTTQEAKVVSGIKMKVEESLIGGKSSLIVVSFSKEDGTAFIGDISIPTLELDQKQNASYMVEQQMTEDGKKLIALFDLDTTSSIHGKKVTILADKLIDTQTNKVVANGPFDISFVASENPTSQNIKVNLNLSELNEEVTLTNVNISANGIGIEGKRLDDITDKLPKYEPLVEVTTKDNQTIELKSSSTSTTDSGFKLQYNLTASEERLFLYAETITRIIIDGHVIDVLKK